MLKKNLNKIIIKQNYIYMYNFYFFFLQFIMNFKNYLNTTLLLN